MRGVLVPRSRLDDRPAAGALPIETELRAEPIKAVERVALRVPELAAAYDRRHGELALCGERLRVDDEPRLARSGEHVLPVQILMDEDELALRRRELPGQLADLAV